MKSGTLRTKFRTWRWKVNIYHLLLVQEVEVLSRIKEGEDLTDEAPENSGRIVLGRKSRGSVAFLISPSV